MTVGDDTAASLHVTRSGLYDRMAEEVPECAHIYRELAEIDREIAAILTAMAMENRDGFWRSVWRRTKSALRPTRLHQSIE